LHLNYMFITKSWKEPSIGKITFAKTTIAQTSYLLLKKTCYSPRQYYNSNVLSTLK